MTQDPGPAVRRRQLGTALRRYREAAGMSAKEAAEHLLISPAKISRLENAQRSATLRDVRDLCEIYGITDEQTRSKLMELARDSRLRGWWQGADLNPALERLIGLEGSARRINQYEIIVVPGILQTPPYARAMLEVFLAEDGAGQERSLAARLKRQELLTSPPVPAFSLVLDEATLHRSVGGPAVMRQQIAHLLEMMSKNVVDLRVVPFSAGAHLGMITAFTILEFGENDELGVDSTLPDVVYYETVTGSDFYDQEALVRTYRDHFDEIRSRALTEPDTRDLLTKVMKGL